MTAAPAQPSLFPPDRKCTCHATNVAQCRWQQEREHGELPGKQPRACLLRPDPAYGEVPY